MRADSFKPRAIPEALRTAFADVSGAGKHLEQEMIGAHSGLGFLTLNSQEVFQIPSMYAGILLLAVVGLLLNFLLALLERRFTYWRRGLRHGG